MTNLDPLDAPLKERKPQPTKKKEDYIYSPRQMRLFKRGVWMVLALNSMLYAVIAGRNKISESLSLGFWLQLIIVVLLGIIVGIYALFRYRYLPYGLRFGQWFTLYFLSAQCFVTLLLIVALVFG